MAHRARSPRHQTNFRSPDPFVAMLRRVVASPGRRVPALPLLTAPARGRKSRTDPPAKSKANRINVPPPVDPAELLVLRERYRKYGRILGAIRGPKWLTGSSPPLYPHNNPVKWARLGVCDCPKVTQAEFKQEMLQQHYEEKFGELGRQRKEAVDEEHRQLMVWNDAENQRLQERREERLRKEEGIEEEYRLRRAQTHATLLEEILKEKEREVLQLQEEAQSFITLANLDERIEECLNNPRNYNFAINKDGQVVKQTVLS